MKISCEGTTINLVPENQTKGVKEVTLLASILCLLAALKHKLVAMLTANAASAVAAAAAVASGNLVLSDGTVVTVKRAFLDVLTNTTGAVVAAVVGKKVRILALHAQVGATAQTITLKRGTTAVSGAMLLPVAGKIERPFCKDGWYETAVNEAFNAVLAAAGSTTSFEVLYAEV